MHIPLAMHTLAAIKMTIFHAMSNQFGVPVSTPQTNVFSDDAGAIHADADRFYIAVPGHKALEEWAQSCLSLGSHCNTRPGGGWSPFRSAELRAGNKSNAKHWCRKLGEYILLCWIVLGVFMFLLVMFSIKHLEFIFCYA